MRFTIHDAHDGSHHHWSEPKWLHRFDSEVQGIIYVLDVSAFDTPHVRDAEPASSSTPSDAGSGSAPQPETEPPADRDDNMSKLQFAMDELINVAREEPTLGIIVVLNKSAYSLF